MIVFTNGNTEYTDFGSDASFDDLTTRTLIVLQRARTLVAGAVVLSKRPDGGPTVGWQHNYSGTTGQLSFNRRMASNATNYVSGDNLAAPANTWRWLAWSFDPGGIAGQKVKMYGGAFGGTIAETSTYITTTDDTGGANSDAALNIRLGNYHTTPATAITPSSDFEYLLLYNTILNITQIQQIIDGIEDVGVNPITTGLLLQAKTGWGGGTTGDDVGPNNLDGTTTNAINGGAGPLEGAVGGVQFRRTFNAYRAVGKSNLFTF